MARLVEAAITQLDMMIEDPPLGAIARTDQDDAPSPRRSPAVVEDHARPALAAYREALRNDGAPHRP